MKIRNITKKLFGRNAEELGAKPDYLEEKKNEVKEAVLKLISADKEFVDELIKNVDAFVPYSVYGYGRTEVSGLVYKKADGTSEILQVRKRQYDETSYTAIDTEYKTYEKANELVGPYVAQVTDDQKLYPHAANLILEILSMNKVKLSHSIKSNSSKHSLPGFVDHSILIKEFNGRAVEFHEETHLTYLEDILEDINEAPKDEFGAEVYPIKAIKYGVFKIGDNVLMKVKYDQMTNIDWGPREFEQVSDDALELLDQYFPINENIKTTESQFNKMYTALYNQFVLNNKDTAKSPNHWVKATSLKTGEERIFYNGVRAHIPPKGAVKLEIRP